MGSDLIVFLEFYGLPGCGKSTISHLVAEELRKQGKIVKEPTYDLDHKLPGGKRKTIKLLRLLQYGVFHHGQYKYLTQMIKDNGYSGAEIVSQAANIAPKLWVYEKASADYVVFDEGLVQSAISLCRGKRNSTENETALHSLCEERKVLKIYIRVNTETALERMAGRDKHDSRIEKISGPKEQREALKAFEERIECISSGLVIDEGTIDASVKKIMLQICD